MSAYDDLTFAPMLITDVFETMGASAAQFGVSSMRTIGDKSFPHVGQSELNNGSVRFIPEQEVAPNDGGAITVGVDTQSVFYQPVPFYTTEKVLVVRHKSLNMYSGLVLCSALRDQFSKFSWGYKASSGRLAKTRIMVPVTTDDSGEQIVDWDGMTRLGEELILQAVTRAHSARTADDAHADVDLPDLRFEPMLMSDLFRFHRGRAGERSDAGGTPYIVAASRNNSHAGFVTGKALFPGNWLAVVNTGAGGVGYCTYQPVPFWASNNVTALEPVHKGATPSALLVLTACVRFQTFGKFTYGNIANTQRLKATRIMVPVTTEDSGEQVVDWEGMTRYGQILRARAERKMEAALELLV